jgi:hypothetical protein
VPIREVVSQISPPIRILLVLTVAVLGAYMMFLRPKAEEVPPVDSAGTTTTQPATVETEEPAAATAPATKSEAGSAPSAAAPAAKPGEGLKGLPKPVRKAIRDNKTLVVLFSNGKSYDDKAVEKALTKINRWDGRVYVHTAPLRRISRYGRIARGVSVEQSPTVVVADRELRAETLVGYVDRGRIDQAVVDARRNSEGIYVDSYIEKADEVCFAHSNRWDSTPFYYIGGPRQGDRRLAELDTVYASFVADYKALDAPKQRASFHSAVVADMAAYQAVLHRASVAVTPKMNRVVFTETFNAAAKKSDAIDKRLSKRFKSANLPRCGSQF